MRPKSVELFAMVDEAVEVLDRGDWDLEDGSSPALWISDSMAVCRCGDDRGIGQRQIVTLSEHQVHVNSAFKPQCA